MAHVDSTGRGTFYKLRLGALFTLFLLVATWAFLDIKQRRARNAWQRPLHVGLVVLRMGDVSDESVRDLRRRVPALEEQLTVEFKRFGGGKVLPFMFMVYGPLDVASPPPSNTGEGILDLMKFTYQQWRYLREVDQQVGASEHALDSQIYLVARPPSHEKRHFVEGQSQQGGRIGVVQVELDGSMIDFALFVAAHELFHTLGASDKYGADGHALEPDGLAEPDLVPLYPQRFIELMARNKPIAPGVEEPPGALEELRVGRATAREIGWAE